MEGNPLTLAFFDADIIAFKAASVGANRYNFAGTVCESPDLGKALKAADHIVRSWCRGVGTDSFTLVFSGAENFRKKLNKDYKANRKDKSKPVLLPKVVSYLKSKYPCMEQEGLEADDLMSIKASTYPHGKGIIVSIDKDMASVPGWLYNPDANSRPYKVSEAAAIRSWLTQTLTGDPVDGYSGCPKIGAVKAKQILQNCYSLTEAWRAVVRAFEGAGLTEDDALLQARMARILRAEDWDDEKEEIKLWHPTTSTALSSLKSASPSTTRSAKQKSSTSSKKSVTTTPADKQKTLPTSSSTSAERPTKVRRKRTSSKSATTQTDSSKTSLKPKKSSEKTKPNSTKEATNV